MSFLSFIIIYEQELKTLWADFFLCNMKMINLIEVDLRSKWDGAQKPFWNCKVQDK